MGWGTREDIKLHRLVIQSEGYDVGTLTNTNIFDDERTTGFGKVPLKTANQLTMRQM